MSPKSEKIVKGLRYWPNSKFADYLEAIAWVETQNGYHEDAAILNEAARRLREKD